MFMQDTINIVIPIKFTAAFNEEFNKEVNEHVKSIGFVKDDAELKAITSYKGGNSLFNDNTYNEELDQKRTEYVMYQGDVWAEKIDKMWTNLEKNGKQFLDALSEISPVDFFSLMEVEVVQDYDWDYIKIRCNVSFEGENPPTINELFTIDDNAKITAALFEATHQVGIQVNDIEKRCAYCQKEIQWH